MIRKCKCMPIFFSVLVPVYNVEEYVAECIESVLNQNYSFLELILVDDGSTDHSGEICDQYGRIDQRIKVFHKTNQGLLHTRRYAIDKASGDYYVFLDSDDMIKKEALETIAQKIEGYQCDCLIYGYEKVQNGIIVSKTEDIEEACENDKRKIYRKCLLSTDMNSLCRKAVKANVFHDFDYSLYYHIQHSEDLLQSLEIYKNSKSIAFINDKLYIYRTNPNSITQKKEKQRIDFTVREKVLEHIEKEKVFTDDDYNLYRDFCVSLLIDKILRIAQSEKRDSQIILYKEIRNSKYYQNFLKTGITHIKTVGLKSIIFYLFKNGNDRLIKIVSQLSLWIIRKKNIIGR